MPVDIYMNSIEFIYNCVSSTASDAKHRATGSAMIPAPDGSGELWLPLFTLPKSLDCIIPVFIHSLLNGTVTQRELAATALGEFAVMSEPNTVLKPHLIKTTGPLIRVVGDRFPSSLKLAILQVRRLNAVSMYYMYYTYVLLITVISVCLCTTNVCLSLCVPMRLCA